MATAKQQFARVTIGYRNYIMPLASALKLAEMMPEMIPVEEVRWTLQNLAPEYKGKWMQVSPSDMSETKFEVALFAEPPKPYVDQQAEIDRINALRAEISGEDNS